MLSSDEYSSEDLTFHAFANNANHNNGHQNTTVQVLTGEEALKLEEVEANMKQLQADLHQAKSRNIYLNDLVEEQKR